MCEQVVLREKQCCIRPYRYAAAVKVYACMLIKGSGLISAKVLRALNLQYCRLVRWSMVERLQLTLAAILEIHDLLQAKRCLSRTYIHSLQTLLANFSSCCRILAVPRDWAFRSSGTRFRIGIQIWP